MKKSVYSLVLADDLVRALDQLAYLKRTSRSNLINQILAEHLSLATPEKRMKEILARMEKQMCGETGFQLAVRPTDSQLSLRSSLSYKYNPTVQYSVVLYRDMESTFGELRVSFRTQNRELLNLLTDFFRIWSNMENTYIAHLFPGERVACEIRPGRFTRELLIPDGKAVDSEAALADAASHYIRLFDTQLKVYFESPSAAPVRITEAYLDYLRSGAVII